MFASQTIALGAGSSSPNSARHTFVMRSTASAAEHVHGSLGASPTRVSNAADLPTANGPPAYAREIVTRSGEIPTVVQSITASSGFTGDITRIARRPLPTIQK